MEVRYVEWVDSSGGSGWEPVNDVAAYRPFVISTVGFVISEDEDHVGVIQSYDERLPSMGKAHADHWIMIPKSAVRKMLTLRKAR